MSEHTADDGTPLHLRDWPPAGPQAAHGTVLIVHGLGEHSGRYEHVAAALNAWGWHAVAYDHRGHGRSGGPRGAIPDADALLRDLGGVIDGVRKRFPAPLILLGHSLGGLIVARFVAEGTRESPARWYRETDGLVLSSPALDPGMNGAQKLLLAVLGPLAPGLAVGNGLKPAWISNDPAVVAAYQADPLVHDRVTPRLVRFIVDGGEFVRQCAPRWQMPTLLLWAGADRCVAPAGSAAFAAAAPAALVKHREFAGMAHEIFNEPDQRKVFDALAAWLVPRAA